MRIVERVVTAVVVCAAACAPVDRGALESSRDAGATVDVVTAVDAQEPSSDVVTPGVDAPVTTVDVPVATVDVPRVDVPVTTVDVPVTTVDVPVTTVDVVMPMSDVVTPTVDAPPPPRDAGPPDPCSSSTTCGACTPRNGCGWCSNGAGCLTGNARMPSNGACTTAQWAWTTSMCPATPPVDAGPPDAGPPDAGCRACATSTAVTFCAGAGTCLPVQGCASACATCEAPTAGGDNCGSAVVLSTTGRQRTVLTTCGAADDINSNCGVSGPDLVVALRVQRRGTVTARFTVPTGVRVNFGYDFPPLDCRADRLTRQCNSTSTASTQGFSLTLDPATYYLYVVTSQPATVVVDTELP